MTTYDTDLMREALEKVEWEDDSEHMYVYCPWCGETYYFGSPGDTPESQRKHAPDCLRQRALGITLPEMAKVRYWRKNSWPYSIDQKIEGAELCEMEIPKGVTYVEDGKRWLYWEFGHGEYVNLLVE